MRSRRARRSGCGRPAEALAAYQRLRVALSEELGVDPSRELAELHTTMLRGATTAQLRAPGSILGSHPIAVSAGAPRPAQLPAPAGYLTGRATEMDELDAVALISTTPGPPNRFAN